MSLRLRLATEIEKVWLRGKEENGKKFKPDHVHVFDRHHHRPRFTGTYRCGSIRSLAKTESGKITDQFWEQGNYGVRKRVLYFVAYKFLSNRKVIYIAWKGLDSLCKGVCVTGACHDLEAKLTY